MEVYTARKLIWPVTIGPSPSTSYSRKKFSDRRFEYVSGELFLEGLPVTPGEVEAVVSGSRIPSLSPEDTQRVIALNEAVGVVLAWTLHHRIKLTLEWASELNTLIATAEGVLEPGVVRGRGRVEGGGHVNGPGFQFSGPPSGVPLEEFLERHLDRIYSIREPALVATVTAALFAYAQPFPDGNKRTGRLMMNASLLVNGQDAIFIPDSREREYVAAVAEMYRTADATPYVEFLLGCRG